MAARLTDRQKKQIVADYTELGSYNAVAKIHGISKDTVRRSVAECADFAQNAQQKKEENAADILAHMESKKEKVCRIIDIYLDELLDVRQFEKLTPNQLTTALGTLIDKWTAIGAAGPNGGREDALSRSLRELGGTLESDAD